ncbi:electron transport complex subunit RsxA [Buchnera aphidicola (Aphis craccivora)]|uniref:Ion-translocating oxidoreductase complex subunit A n=1 Tax=Buchnera aphidicola (Aphis craccivora) TaxID=466616 RepID=A0A4D6XU10_9GAMM|nr:electron transport complex subunit RsxA [Buchnera aphidicola]QCI16375.1 electron transport complex subunit RsxA [Buchnera aphidicola (Aphis craccivora)]QLL40518.1 electron transport complex subunit RsxA [Buchnera aphidicola (Aphis craccivore)]WAI17888.1 MAG: electron transport complex subunit RsxA [Buchnera aphidicola (Aphis craccivora)]
MKSYFLFFISNILIDNFILVKFLGLCPFTGASNKLEIAVGISFSTIFVVFVSTMILWCINFLILSPFNLVYLRIIIYMLVISFLVQFLEIILRNTSPFLYRILGIFLPLITTNCAVLAIPLFCLYENYTFLDSIFYALSSSFGFALVMIIFASIRERILLSDVPVFFKGSPIILITISLISISFMGFRGLIKI